MAHHHNVKHKGKHSAQAQKQPSPESLQRQDDSEANDTHSKSTKGKSAQNKRERCRYFLERWKVLLQLIVPSVFSAALLITIVVQIYIYNRQLREMKKTTKAAIESLEFARQNAIRDQRPWVTMPTAVCSKPLTADERIEVTCQFSNSGRSPALAEMRYRFFFSQSESAKEVEWNKSEQPESIILIAPNLGYNTAVTSDLVLTKEQIELARSKIKWLFLKVAIRYKDTAGNNYTTKVCMKCGGEAVDNRHLLACGSGQKAK
jgi:hypothetical protein